MATLETIGKILNETLDIEIDEVTEDSSFEELGVDSLDMAELVSEIEDVFDIEFGEPDGIETVGDLVSYIESL